MRRSCGCCRRSPSRRRISIAPSICWTKCLPPFRRRCPHDDCCRTAAAERSGGAPEAPYRTGEAPLKGRPTGLLLRQATADDAPAIHELIVSHLAEGHLLPRQLERDRRPRASIRRGGRRRPLTEQGRSSAASTLAPLSRTVAEVRSLVVSEDARSSGIGRRLIDAAVARRGPRRVRAALRVHARAVVFRAARVLARAARMASREDSDRLQHVRALPPMRSVRGRASARARHPWPACRWHRSMADASTLGRNRDVDRRWHHRAAGIYLRLAALRHQGEERRARPDGRGRRRSRLPPRACSRPTSRRPRRCCCRSSICSRRRDWHERSSSTAAARMPARARRGLRMRETMASGHRARRSAAPVEQVLVASTGVIGVNLQDGQGHARHPYRGRRNSRAARAARSPAPS